MGFQMPFQSIWLGWNSWTSPAASELKPPLCAGADVAVDIPVLLFEKWADPNS
jgi:hypothetical protein